MEDILLGTDAEDPHPKDFSSYMPVTSCIPRNKTTSHLTSYRRNKNEQHFFSPLAASTGVHAQWMKSLCVSVCVCVGMMPPCHSPSIFWFLLLLGAGSLLLLLHWSQLNVIQLLATGFMDNTAPEGDDMLDSELLVNNLLNVTDSSEEVLALLEEELQKQLRIQVSRHRHLANVCSKHWPNVLRQVPTKGHLAQVFVEDRSKLLYCEVPKVGCSNWKRVLMVLAGKATSLLGIPHDTVHENNKLLQLFQFNPDGITERLNNYRKVLFVREPFERLVSAFRDKLENPNVNFHNNYGRLIISRYRTNASQKALKTGDGVTFREFVQYLLDPRRPHKLNIHWMPVSMLCHPCLLHYDFIGKFENMNREANFLLRSMGAPSGLRYPDYKDRNPQDERTSSSIMKKYFSQLSATERQRVYDFYYMDYLLFNYSKPLPDLL